MTRYHVDTPAQLALVQVAIDQALGLRNGAGAPTPREQLVRKGSVVGPASQIIGPAHQCYDRPGTKARLIDGGDGTAALEIDDDAPINAALGTTVSGVPLPSAASLVQVTRARQNALLPTGVRDKLDDAYVDSVFADITLNDGQRRAAVNAELQNGARGTNALARKDLRGSQAALEMAMGLRTRE